MTALPEQLHAPRTASTAVATTAPTGPGVGFDALGAQDVRLPRMKFAQGISGAVTDRLVEFGAIYVAFGKDDPEPVTIAKPGARGEAGPEVQFHVLGATPGWSYTDTQGDLGRVRPRQDGEVPYPDLSLVKDSDPRNVRRTYDYLLSVPDYPDLPVMFLMHGKWGGESSKTINTRIKMAQVGGKNPSELTFAISAKGTKSDKGAFMQSQVRLVELKAKDLAAHRELIEFHLALVGSGANVVVAEDEAPRATTGEQPAAPSLD